MEFSKIAAAWMIAITFIAIGFFLGRPNEATRCKIVKYEILQKQLEWANVTKNLCIKNKGTPIFEDNNSFIPSAIVCKRGRKNFINRFSPDYKDVAEKEKVCD